jgi:DNA-binding transcriptional ArsR family regulator
MVINKRPPLDRVFHALADPTRRRILEQLAHQDQPVMELARLFAISQPAVTKHLHVLEGAGLITRRKEGRLRCCRIQPKALQASLDWIQRCRSFWNERLDALEEFLAESTDEGPKNVRQ